jgi:GntR family transcriptional repressor for pyruvate dehydrogenase complex
MTTAPNAGFKAEPRSGPARDLVVRHVRALIEGGTLRQGQQLPTERELVRATGLSRTSVRTGLQSLVAKGVLVTRRGAGTFVAEGPPTLDADALGILATLHGFSRAEMFEARRTLEVRVAGLAAERATGDQLATISDEVTGMYAALEDRQVFLVHDIRFHRAVASASGNPILAAMVEMVSSLFYERRRQTANLGDDPRTVADVHRQIYQAIRNRDRARAERVMNEHLLMAEREQGADLPAPEPAARPRPPGTQTDDTFPAGAHGRRDKKGERT